MALHPQLPLWQRGLSAVLAVIVPLSSAPLTFAQAAKSAAAVPLTGKPLPDAFSRDWTPPAPQLSAKDLKLNEAPVVTAPHFEIPEGVVFAKEALVKTHVLDTPLVYTADSDPTENELARITEALRAHQRAGGVSAADGRTRLVAVAQGNATSGFALSFQIEAAESAWRNGFFTDSLRLLNHAWASGKALVRPEARQLAELSLSRLLERTGLLGKRDDLRALLESVKDESLGGQAAETRKQSGSVLWFLDNRAERNIFCGYTAANAVCVPLGKRPILPDVDDPDEKIRFIQNGLSAFDLKKQSIEDGSPLKVIKRGAGAPVVVPSAVHWNYLHYSAVVQKDEKRGLYRIKDEHIGFDSWVPQAAIDEQSTGYFLIPAETPIPAGYTEATDDEAKKIFGRHCTHQKNPEGNKCTTCPQPVQAMASSTFDVFNASLMMQDVPVIHRVPFGPSLNLTLTYDQRSTIIPDIQNYMNIGKRWTLGVLEYITITNSSTSNTVASPTTTWRRGDGSYYNYTLPTAPGSTVYDLKYKERPRMIYAPKTGTMPNATYTLVFADGTKKVFAQPDAASPSKFFLTQIVDVDGNGMTFYYDSALRITSIQSVLPGVTLSTTFGYTAPPGDGVPTDTLKVRLITDPFGRQAKLSYNAVGQLETITDPAGIVSRFHYGAGDFIDRLTTPYGITEYTSGTMPGINAEPGHFIELKDPNGDRERVEISDFGLPVTYNDPQLPANPQNVTVGGVNVSFMPKNYFMYYRNSFHWDKKQMQEAPGDYTKARIYNWLASTSDTITGVPASIKDPLESRVWYNYPGQLSESSTGTLSLPSKILRSIEGPTGATTWSLSQTDYNDWGKVTRTVDADGREMDFTYDVTGQDLTQVTAKNGASTEVLSTITYQTVAGASTHRPATITGADGTATTYAYNSKGQPLTVTVSNGGNSQTTHYTYDTTDPGLAGATCGYLQTIEQTSPSNPAAYVTWGQLTYDTAKRPRTVTNAQLYTLTFDYDGNDRPTLITHPDSTTQQFSYAQDGVGLLDCTAVKDRMGRWTRTRYNALGQPILVIDPALRATYYEWCKCGSLSRLTDAMGQVTFWKRDLEGRVSYKQLPDGKRYTYAYQPLSGRLASVAYPIDTDASRTTYTNSYALAGQLLKKDYTDAGMADVTFAYNDYLGRLTSMTDGVGTTNYTYNVFTAGTPGAGQVATINGPFANDTLRYSYDWLGRAYKTEVVNDASVATRTEQTSFDTLSRATQTINDLGTFTSTYGATNLTGLPDSVSLPGGLSSVYTQYAAGAGANALRLHSIEHHNADTTVWQNHGYTYDLTGNITNWTQTHRQWALGYDAVDQLSTEASTLLPSNTFEEARTWQYDANGNMLSRTQETPAGGKTLELRQHSGRNQLTSIGGAGRTLVDGTVDEPSTVTVSVAGGTAQPARVTSQSPTGPWRFQKEADFPVGSTTLTINATDANGNTRTQSYSVTVSNTETRNLVYDTNGNLQTKTYLNSGAAYRRETYTWDAENRLTGWEDRTLGTPDVITATTAWTYDGLGRRVKEHDVVGATTTDHVSVWDGLEMVQWLDLSGGLQRNLHGEGEQDTSASYLYLTDHLGNVRGWHRLSDGARGEADYSAFGQQSVVSNTTGVVPLKSFTGHYQHQASGLILAPYRPYDAELGRWLSEDPIGEEGGLNLYGYVNNNPSNSYDPDGLEIAYANHVVGGGQYHAKVIITPANQDKWKNDPRFVNVDANGNHFLTIGAGPDKGWPFGAMIAGLNRKKDVSMPQCEKRALTLPGKYKNEDEAIQALLDLEDYFEKNAKVGYTLLPQGASTYNSNSFNSSLLYYAGFLGSGANMGFVPHANNTPGYTNKIPKSNFAPVPATPWYKNPNLP